CSLAQTGPRCPPSPPYTPQDKTHKQNAHTRETHTHAHAHAHAQNPTATHTLGHRHPLHRRKLNKTAGGWTQHGCRSTACSPSAPSQVSQDALRFYRCLDRKSPELHSAPQHVR